MAQLKHNLYLGFVVSILGLMAGAPLAAANPRPEQANWDNVKQLAEGQEIKVVLNDAKAYRGHFLSVTDEALRVALPTGSTTFTREEILRISFKTGTHRLRNAGIGAAIGSGALAAAWGAKPPFCEQEHGCPGDRGIAAAAGAGIGAAMGAGVGAVLPASDAFRDVYRAR